MKHLTTLILLLFYVAASAQISVDFSYGHPIHLDDLNEVQIALENNRSLVAGLKYMPGKLGLGIQYGLHNYATNQDLLAQMNEIPGSFRDSPASNWRTGLLAIGPVFRLGKSRLNLEAFPKFGLASIRPPDQRVVIRDGLEETLLYQENHEESGLANSNLFYGIDGRVNFGITEAIGVSLSLGYHTNAGLGEGTSVIYRELGDVGPNTTSEEVRRNRLLRHDCDAYSLLTTTIGVSFSFGKKKKPNAEDAPERMLPPQPRIPEDQSVIALQNAQELQLEWAAENPEVLRANYLVFLYEQTARGDSLIFRGKTEQQLQLVLPEQVELREGRTYRWRVQAVDDRRLDPCPGDCYSITYEFAVDGLGLPQFYQLLDRNLGSPVPTGSKLRILGDPGLFFGEEVRILITDERNEVILESTLEETKAEWVKELAEYRFELDLQSLEADRQYNLQLTNGKRSQYLRFVKPKKQLRDERP